ncbi:MAG: NUMOD3 domain-containing DNA-binding protein [Nanoarchaeota archaeon]|nr:NUMOD3 domain-containing DNA-binding protein [Nanoarchaeota archaeon]
MKRISGIYCIVNIVNGKIYIGSAINLRKRYVSHKNSLNRGDHHNSHLQRSWNKYGECCFDFQILEICEKKKSLIKKEQYWLDYYRSYDREIGYNISFKAGSTLGVKCSEEKKIKISNFHKGKKLSEEHRKKLSDSEKGENNPFYGKHHSEESKRKISESRKGTIPWNFGKPWGEEMRKKLSKSQRGEKSHNAKLTWEIVREIRDKYIPYRSTMKMLSREYGIPWKTISSIIYNETWKEEEQMEEIND